MTTTFTKREVALLVEYVKEGYSLDNAIILLRGNPAATVPDMGAQVADAWRWCRTGDVQWTLGFYPPDSADIVKEPLYARRACHDHPMNRCTPDNCCRSHSERGA